MKLRRSWTPHFEIGLGMPAYNYVWLGWWLLTWGVERPWSTVDFSFMPD